jgi:hypothetical protein
MADHSEFDRADRRLRELLLAYLQAATVSAWPGTDGLTVEDVLDGYPQAVAAGEVPDWQQLLRQHHELGAALQDWLAAKDRWQFAYHRGRVASSPGGEEPRMPLNYPNAGSSNKESTS